MTYNKSNDREYERERNRLWFRLRTARNRHKLLKAREAAGLDLETGMTVRERVQVESFREWFRAAEYAAFVNPTTASTEDDLADLLSVINHALLAARTDEFRDRANDMMNEIYEWRASRQQAGEGQA